MNRTRTIDGGMIIIKYIPKNRVLDDDQYAMTLEEIGLQLGIDRTNVHNIIRNACRKIRHKRPKLKEFLE